jgi:hypothetical protein
MVTIEILDTCQDADLSTYYLRYYWWETITYNIDFTGQANLGRNMRYYWMGRSYIKYAILLNQPIYVICDITGWAHHI